MLQARSITLDIEEKLIDELIKYLIYIRESFELIVREAETVASVSQITSFKELDAERMEDQETGSKRKRKRKCFFNEDDNNEQSEADTLSLEENFKRDVFYCLIDSLLLNLRDRSKAVREINSLHNVHNVHNVHNYTAA